MTEHYLDRLARTINANWDAHALTDFYLTEDGTAQDTSRGNHYTYGEMYIEMLRLGELFKQLGLQKGDHIAICGANSAHWAIAYLAIAAYQGVSVTVLHTQSPEDIARQIDFSDAKALFTDEALWRDLKGLSLPLVNHVISLDSWKFLRGEEVKISNHDLRVDRQEACFELRNLDDLAMICFTSGSSGSAKGVMLSYRNISNNISDFVDMMVLDDNRNYLLSLSFAHVSGLLVEFFPHIIRGKYIYVYADCFTIDQYHKALTIIRPYILSHVPPVLNELNKKYGIVNYLVFVKEVFTGASVIDETLEKEMLSDGVPLVVIYGMTETTGGVTVSLVGNHRAGTCGKLFANLVLRISQNDEILVKGDNVMLGYYKNPEATAQKIDADGWLHTGDRGYLDEDGYLYVEGRLEQDIIVLPNGENIHPDNIESKINALPEVAESIVIAREGKLVAIVVVSGELSADSRTALRLSILRSVNAQLPMYAQIYDIEWSDEPLARTAKQTLKRHLYK